MRLLRNAAGAGLFALLAGVILLPVAADAGPVVTAPTAKAASNVVAVHGRHWRRHHSRDVDYGWRERRRYARHAYRNRWRDDDFIYSRSRYNPDYYIDDGDDYEYVTVYRSVRTVIVEPPYADVYVRRRGGRIFTPFVDVYWRD